MKKYYIIIAVIVFSCVSLFFSGCGNATGGGSGGGGSSSRRTNRTGTYSYSGTQSPGDVWTWTISTETFLGSDETTGIYYSGTWEILASGFSKAYILDSDEKDFVTKEAYFLEFPDTMLLVQPTSSDGFAENVVACAAHSSDQPVADIKYLSVNIPGQNWKEESKGDWMDNLDAWGSVHLQANQDDPSLWDLASTNFLLAGDPPPPSSSWSVTAETYSNGRFSGGYANSDTYTKQSAPDVSNFSIFLTPSAMYMGDFGPGNGGFVGVSLETIDGVDAAAHSFRGYKFKYFPDSGTGETYPIALSNDSSGKLKIQRYQNDDVNGSLFTTNEAIFTVGSQDPDSYIISSEAVDDSGTTPIRTVMAKVGSSTKKYVFFSFGIATDGYPINIMAVQSD